MTERILTAAKMPRDFGDLPADTYRHDCMPTEIYPYWAGLCCMADIDSLTPRGIAAITVLYSENKSHLAVV